MNIDRVTNANDNTVVASSNKLIVLITHMRSCSTPLVRSINNLSVEVFNENSQYAFALTTPYKDAVKPWFRDNAPTTFAEVKERVFKALRNNNVLMKEESIAVSKFIPEDEEFIKNPAIRFVFLVRNPHHAVISFYQKSGVFEGFSNFLGYKAILDIYNAVREKGAIHPLIIIHSEDLYNKPKETMEKFCSDVEIPYDDAALTWEPLGDDFTGEKEWHEIKVQEKTKYWHREAMESSGFKKPSEYAVDENGSPTFAEISDVEDQKACQKAYTENMDAYLMIKEHSDAKNKT